MPDSDAGDHPACKQIDSTGKVKHRQREFRRGGTAFPGDLVHVNRMRAEEPKNLVRQRGTDLVFAIKIVDSAVVCHIMVVGKGVLVKQKLPSGFGETEGARAGKRLEYILDISDQGGAVTDQLIAATGARVLRRA
jgi:hypothetical protein